MAISDILEIGKQGLAANREALTTTSSNVSNANTPGYSRQRPVMRAREMDASSGVRVGGGVEVARVIRVHDSFVEKRIVEEAKNFGTAQTKYEGMRRVENSLFNGGSHLGEQMNQFFNDFRELSLNPELTTVRGSIAHSVESISMGFRKANDELENMRRDLEFQIEYTVNDVNGLTKELGKLNSQIFQHECIGHDANELSDRRDQVVRDIAAKLGVQATQDDQGNFNVISSGLGVLVHGDNVTELITMRTPEDGSKSSGSLDVFSKSSKGVHQVTDAVQEGELGGFIHVRDRVINPAVKDLDRIAYRFSNAVNEVHRKGIGRDGQTGRDLFAVLETDQGAARKIGMSDALKQTSENIAAGIAADAPGDNRIALEMADLQHASLFPELRDTTETAAPRYNINETLNSMMGNIATETHRSEIGFQHQKAVVDQLENYKQSISGVSLEEEAVNIVQFQTAFNASARTMRVADELLKEVLALKD